MMAGLVDHKRTGEAVKKSDKYMNTKSGQYRMQKTTVGWEILVEWNDGSKQWVDLHAMKKSNSVQITEYVVVLWCVVLMMNLYLLCGYHTP